MEQFFQELFASPSNHVQNKEARNMKCSTTIIAKQSGFCRGGLSFFDPDPMHAHLLDISEEPAFPDKDDIPKNDHYSFDVYYIFVNGKYHRITLTRAHKIKNVSHACFVDGNVIYAASPKGFLLINQQEWKSSFESEFPYRFSFFIGDTTKIYVYPNSALNPHFKLWQLPVTRHPLYYGIFVNNQNTVSGRTIEEDNRRGRLCPSALYLIFALPLWVLWILFAVFCLNPCFYYARSCKVRRYFIEGGEEGSLRQRELVGSEHPLEKASLLGSIQSPPPDDDNIQENPDE